MKGKKCQIYFFILFINRKNQCKFTGSDAQFAGYNKNFLNEKKKPKIELLNMKVQVYTHTLNTVVLFYFSRDRAHF